MQKSAIRTFKLSRNYVNHTILLLSFISTNRLAPSVAFSFHFDGRNRKSITSPTDRSLQPFGTANTQTASSSLSSSVFTYFAANVDEPNNIPPNSNFEESVSDPETQHKFENKSYISRIKAFNLAGMVGTSENSDNENRADGTIVINLNPGLVAVTGETGSGKSLLLNKAVNLAIGGKAGNIIQSNEFSSNKESSQEIRVEMEITLSPSQCPSMLSIFKSYGLDSAILTDTNKIVFSRTIRRPPGKIRLQSTCAINGQTVTLRDLSALSSSLLTIVDAPTASTTFGKANARMAILDQGVNRETLVSVRETAKQYQTARKKRERIELEIQQRESFLPLSILQSKEDGNDEINFQEETLRMLEHWVEELDEFEQRMIELQSQAANIVFVTLGDNKTSNNTPTPKSKSKSKSNSISSYNSNPSLHDASTRLANSEWTSQNQDEEEINEEFSNHEFYTHLLDFREALKELDSQLDHVKSAHDTLVSLSTESSIAIALETVRNHLYDVVSSTSNNNIRGNQEIEGEDSSNSDPIVTATERTHELLNELESVLYRCADSIDGQTKPNGLLNHLERMRETTTISTEDIDLIIADWNALARKHRISPYNLPACHESLRKELEGDTAARDQLPQALDEEKEALKNFEEACQILTNERKAVAERLSVGVSKVMPQLGMEGSQLSIQLNPNARECTSPTAYAGDILGVDSVDFLLSNQNNNRNNISGEDEGHDGVNTDLEDTQGIGKLEQVASSGEKARILLAIETELPGSVGAACGNKIPTSSPLSSSINNSSNLIAVLYDEIDAHVGGRAAVAVARLLSRQSQKGGQVVSITHSASVAAIANQHIVISKSPLSRMEMNKMQVRAESVEGVARRQELARMASGDLASAEGELFAEALLRDGVLQRDGVDENV